LTFGRNGDGGEILHRRRRHVFIWSFALTVFFDGFLLLALLCFLRRALGRLFVPV
jgi:hypothetical protein